MSRQIQVLERFLRKLLNSHDPPAIIELVSIGSKGGRNTLDVRKIDEPLDWQDDEKLQKMIDDFVELAQDDADGFGGVNKYAVIVGTIEGNTIRSPVIRIAGSDEDNGIEGSEPANIDGALAMSMRHNEALMRQFVTLVGSVTAHQAEAIARLSSENARNEEMRLRQFEIQEELMSKKHERDLVFMKEKRREKALQRVLESVTPMLPTVANKLLTGGKAAIEVSKSPQMAQLREFARGLTPDQVNGFMQILNPMQAASLFELLQQIAEVNEKEEGSENEREGNEESGNGGSSANSGTGWH